MQSKFPLRLYARWLSSGRLIEHFEFSGGPVPLDLYKLFFGA